MRTCELRDIANWLLEHDDFMVISHVHPDGDTLGSSFALVLALRQLSKRAFAVCSDMLNRMYSFMALADEIVCGGEKPFEPKSYVSVDVSETFRMGIYEEAFLKADEKIAIDHHETNPGFGNLCYVEPHTAATGEIMLRLVKEMGAQLTADIAECLYTAISTDCGNFSFSCTKPETYSSAAECVKSGADPEKLSRLLFRMRTENITRFLGAALSRIVMSPDKKVAMITLPDSLYTEYGCVKSDSHAFVNYLNEIEGVNVGVLLDETSDGVKASFRGANGTDVAVLAKQFGGGGHSAAAGATLKGATLEQAAAAVMEAAMAHVGEK